jgi:hypothetical protein
MIYKTNKILASCMLLGVILTIVCTSNSTHLAIKGGERVENIQDTINSNQNENLRQYLYNDLKANLQKWLNRDLTLVEADKLNELWNRRDILETWQIQWERARALRMMTVDAKLISDQSPFDMLSKQIKAAIDRASTQPADSQPSGG